MNDLESYMKYLDSIYGAVLKHLESREPNYEIDEHQVDLYFNSIVRPYYYWTQESGAPSSEKKQEEKNGGNGSQEKKSDDITVPQLNLLRDMRTWKKHSKTDEELEKLSKREASKLIEELKKR
ncbi:MAG: hypothetical protein ACYDAZ_00625 [Thermoplasmataceae archaeon]